LNRILKILFITLLGSLVSINPGAKEPAIDNVEKLVPHNVRVTNNISDISDNEGSEKIINTFLRKWSIAGASIAISKDEKLIFSRGFGYADTASGASIQPYSQFRIASISKLITAIGIMKLHEEGRLSLDEKVFGVDGILNEQYFCDPKDKRVYGITVAHLLSHEGGWTQRYGDQMFMPLLVAEKMGEKPPVETKTIVRYALDKNLHFTPGTSRAYSNLGYSILGLIIEKISGMPYEDYCSKFILEHLGIYDMKIAGNLPSEKAPYEVTYYIPPDILPKPSIYGTGELVPPTYGGNDIRALGGAGAWLATAPDLMRILTAVDGFRNRPDILSDQSIRFMTDNSNGYAPVGWKTTIMDGNWWRTGSFPGTAGVMKRQSDGISWVVLFNSSSWNGPDIYSYVNNLMYKVISQINPLPDYDLFNYSIPVPLNTSISQSSSF
jgi:CubicO group peptidase (beta-lactamase class C family)